MIIMIIMIAFTGVIQSACPSPGCQHSPDGNDTEDDYDTDDIDGNTSHDNYVDDDDKNDHNDDDDDDDDFDDDHGDVDDNNDNNNISIIIIIIIMIAFTGVIQDCYNLLTEPPAVLKHVHSSGYGAAVCKSRAKQRVLIT